MVFDSRGFLNDIESENRWVRKKEAGSQNCLFHKTKKFSIAVTLLGLQKETLHQKIYFNIKGLLH
jgi:hypothetical protein